MKVFVLFTGDYEQRSIHSVHSSEKDAEDVWKRLSREYSSQSKADIEEHELDLDLCAVCGYQESLHLEHPDTWKHVFVSP